MCLSYCEDSVSGPYSAGTEHVTEVAFQYLRSETHSEGFTFAAVKALASSTSISTLRGALRASTTPMPIWHFLFEVRDTAPSAQVTSGWFASGASVV